MDRFISRKRTLQFLLGFSILAIVIALGLAAATSTQTHPVRNQNTLQFEKAATDPALRLLDEDEDTEADVKENLLLSTDRLLTDSDGDSLPDAWESAFGLNPNFAEDGQQDPDNDDLTNAAEFSASKASLAKRGLKSAIFDPHKGLDPLNRDTDGDKLPDGWEVKNNLDPLLKSGLQDDQDGDGLINFDEFLHKSDPLKFDTDDDGLNDAAEVQIHKTDPTKEDTDGDEMPDWWELQEKLSPTNPNDRFLDPDNDGLLNGGIGQQKGEFHYRTSPNNADHDGDAIPDGWEVTYGLDPTSFADGMADPDGDALPNREEYEMRKTIYEQSTDPLEPDKDGDFLLDGEEKRAETNPFDADTDADQLGDGDEIHGTLGYFTNPLTKDSDGDELSDGAEILLTRTNPTLFDSDSDLVPDGVEYIYWIGRQEKGKALLESSGLAPELIRLNYGGEQSELIKHMGPFGDPDKDDLLNLLDDDSDGDGILDGREIHVYEYEDCPAPCRDPMGGVDGPYHTDPANDDTDGDKMGDEWERKFSSCPLKTCLRPLDPADQHEDPDLDGMRVFEYDNDTAVRFFSSPFVRQIPDELDLDYSLSAVEPYKPYTNLNEFENKTNPVSADTDCDLIPDGWEAYQPHRKSDAATGQFLPNPSKPDSLDELDADGYDVNRNRVIEDEENFTNLEEWWFFTHPNNNNTDGKPDDTVRILDGAEVYLFQRQYPDTYPQPQVGLAGNGDSFVGAVANTRRTGDLAGCYPDYATIFAQGAQPPVGGAPADDAMPPGGFDVLAFLLAAAGFAMMVLRRPARAFAA